MKLILFITLAASWQMCTASELPKVSCEKIENRRCSTVEKVCLMETDTAIKSTGVTVSSPVNTAVKTISFVNNKQIEYLPENIFHNFPELDTVDAPACALTQLSKANFKNLFKLEKIYLDGNMIERIEGDTFEGLTTLKEIYIPYNRIKFIDVSSLQAQTNLQRFNLHNNECTDQDFKNIENLENVLQEVQEACGQH